MHLTEKELKERIANLNVWKRRGQTAPHKPLLLLLALSKLQHGEKCLTYEGTRSKLKNLLIEFGPRRKYYHPEEPFVRLSTDGLWELNKSVDKSGISDRLLMSEGISGGFTPDVLRLLDERPELIQEVANLILYDHFPEMRHQDILDAVGLNVAISIR
ncbi:hypothetical protein OIN60_05785 [Paenibacillus sp. P96]|uniref:ScoMcrA-like DNA sulfur-binding domain-containing protein n=1 Tax=Paenibacillus zeirhizosphaerae TaxID=2987519 RepID=A0ABT9FNH2_9BACL|nr:hypothetical protein [Paenibacillus sp. P96]MDP4096280.1 hypothetical protein [Paenibacillus sp. P96]